MKPTFLAFGLAVLPLAAWAEGCEGLLTEDYVRDQPSVAVMACVDEAGLDARNEAGETPLHLAAAYGDAGLVRDLLILGADVTLLDREGRTPLDLAALHADDAASIASLVVWGAEANPGDTWVPGERATTPLMLASTRPAADDVVATLLAAGADPRWRNDEGDTALHLALKHGAGGTVVGMLLAGGAPVDAANDEDETPLHFGASYGISPALAHRLLTEGGSADAESVEGVTPLMLAAGFATDPEMFNRLLDAAEDPCKADDVGRTARVLAAANPALRDSDPYWRLNQLCPAAPQ